MPRVKINGKIARAASRDGKLWEVSEDGQFLRPFEEVATVPVFRDEDWKIRSSKKRKQTSPAAADSANPPATKPIEFPLSKPGGISHQRWLSVLPKGVFSPELVCLFDEFAQALTPAEEKVVREERASFCFAEIPSAGSAGTRASDQTIYLEDVGMPAMVDNHTGAKGQRLVVCVEVAAPFPHDSMLRVFVTDPGFLPFFLCAFLSLDNVGRGIPCRVKAKGTCSDDTVVYRSHRLSAEFRPPNTVCFRHRSVPALCCDVAIPDDVLTEMRRLAELRRS